MTSIACYCMVFALESASILMLKLLCSTHGAFVDADSASAFAAAILALTWRFDRIELSTMQVRQLGGLTFRTFCSARSTPSDTAFS